MILASQAGLFIPYCPLYSVQVPEVPHFQDLFLIRTQFSVYNVI